MLIWIMIYALAEEPVMLVHVPSSIKTINECNSFIDHYRSTHDITTNNVKMRCIKTDQIPAGDIELH